MISRSESEIVETDGALDFKRIAFRGYETTLLERETGESGHVEVMIASRAINDGSGSEIAGDL